MELFGNWLWEGLSTDTKPLLEDGARNGQVFKELDTGDTYFLRKGVWENMVSGFSYIKATKSGNAVTGEEGTVDIVFNTAFLSANYTVALSCEDNGSTSPALVTWSSIAAAGFTITVRSSRTGLTIADRNVSWLATMNYDP